MTYTFPFDKEMQMQMVNGRMTRVWVNPYTPEQYAVLEQDLATELGEDFISFEVVDTVSTQQTTVTYTGIMVEDVETDRAAQIDPIYTAWMFANS